MAMADHFLDTETRQDIPWTAWRCLRAGLTVEQARDVWRYEVTPALYWNLWDIAGEWAGWHSDWLAERIAASRVRPGPLSYLRYRCRVHFNHRVWVSIERCAKVLLDLPPGERETAALDLGTLANHYVDFAPRDLSGCDAPERLRLQALEAAALEVLEPVAFADRKPGPARVRAALARAGS